MRSLTILLFAISIASSYTSCQKEIRGPIDPAGSFKAKINSTQWTADKLAGASRFAGMINLTGQSTDQKTLTITLADSGAHRYTLSNATMNVAALIDSSASNATAYTTNQGVYPAESGGEVYIMSIDTAKKTMSGTFSFKTFRQLDKTQNAVTEGSFINLPYVTSMPPASQTDTLRVKINGTYWAPYTLSVFSRSGQIVVNASNHLETKSVGLVFPSNITSGSYTLDHWGQTYIGQYNPDQDPTHAKPSVSGTLHILDHNLTSRRIRGTFAFRGQELLNAAHYVDLTEGYFSVRY
jgi:hypothetical protein